jgi:ATP/maltotriose-dependent transcriptional regulator MalT
MAARRSPHATYAVELLDAMPTRPFLVADHSVNHRPATNVAPLTRREQAILRCVAAGMLTAAIAAHFNIAARTVDWHLQNLYNKLGVSSRTQAIASARATGLLP